tara:strand:+ start:2567 stop:2872 length:306 start_codon:yes stop_codon:yes gene_type:complete
MGEPNPNPYDPDRKCPYNGKASVHGETVPCSPNKTCSQCFDDWASPIKQASNDRAFRTGWSVVKAKKCPSCGGKMGHQWDRDGVCYSCADMEVQNEGGSDV